MKILITGSNGFVGRNLEAYFATGPHELHCPKRQELNLLDCNAVWEYVTRGAFDVVIHCGVTLSSVEENLKMYFHLERCNGSFGKLFCVGSGAEYDRTHYRPRMKEDYFGVHIPQDMYGFSKYVIAKDIESRHRNIYNLRVFGIYGKYEDFKRRFISNNIYRLLCDMDISINRNVYFDYLYVSDFCRIVEMLLDKAPKHRSYNVCNGTPVDLLTLAEIIRNVDGREKPITVKEDGLGPEYTGNNFLLLNEFGPFSFTPHEIAVKEMYHWYRDEGEIKIDPTLLE